MVRIVLDINVLLSLKSSKQKDREKTLTSRTLFLLATSLARLKGKTDVSEALRGGTGGDACPPVGDLGSFPENWAT